MKFYIRRAVVAVVASPAIAGIYVLAYAVLVGLGATPTTDVASAWSIGWSLAITVGLMFTFAPQFLKLVEGK